MALLFKLQLLLLALTSFWTDLPPEQKGIGVAAAGLVLMDKTMTSSGTIGKTIALGFAAMLVWIYAITIVMNVSF